ncbi:hypothetical protein [Novipirellula artificiosorum]|uniref:Uncharacterized protein n=1 Tax=Novipirellula artificiosorum TaxID=2528016 RepID=A0A5C6DGG9_9BACT|nr:hypothetical protein [Novipirellula artificiosorum]TWU34917.1 hypothetical protein Poly41_40600 [Novipirellula artificiosorum]
MDNPKPLEGIMEPTKNRLQQWTNKITARDILALTFGMVAAYLCGL